LKLRFAAHIHGLQRHRIRLQFHSKSCFEIHAGNRHRQFPRTGISPNKARAAEICATSLIPKRGQPRFRLRKSFN